MAFFDFFKKKKEGGAGETFTCTKCGKVKDKSEGFSSGEKEFCCKTCCGDVSAGEQQGKTDKVCEFC